MTIPALLTNPQIIVQQDTSGMAGYLASLLEDISSWKKAGQFVNIALSGGTTPKLIFHYLSNSYREKIISQPVRFFQVDERCVPPDHPESNFRMIRNSLLHVLDIPDDRIFRMTGENDPESGAERYGEVLTENLPTDGKWPVFDLMLLGLGDDGHTASLFPGDEVILHSEKLCEVAVHPITGQKRITLTLPVINRSQNIVFLVTGRQKAQVVSQILQGSGSGNLPAALVSPVHGNLCWLLDREAAGL